MTLDVTAVDPAWVDDRRDRLVVVDVRSPRAYDSLGHVPGAVNVPFDEIRDRDGDAPGWLPDAATVERLLGSVGIDRGDDVVAYDGARGVEAARFLLTLAVYGHDGDRYLLDGDIETWASEYETTTEPTTAASSTGATFDAALRDAAIADRDDVEAAIDDPDVTLLDTRTPDEYDRAHLPGAIQLSWDEFVDDRTGRREPDTTVRPLLEAWGIDPDDEIVLYCNTARRLSYVYTVLSDLGYESVRFHEGDLTDLIRANSPKWDPEQLYENVRAAAAHGVEELPERLGDDVFSRLHLLGLYTTRQDGYFMLRTKVPGGQLTAEQARVIGEIADEFATAPESHGGAEQNPIFGDGFLDVTTRQGIQLHWIEFEDVPEIWDRYEEVGLTTLQASGNTLRNVVVCPAAGLGYDRVDVQSIAEDLADAFEGNRRYANLPRKFKVSLVGCSENCGRAEIQDLGFTPATKDGRDGFAVKVGGGLSDGPRAATDLGIFVDPDRVVDLALAAADLFIDHGRYLDTAVNRLKYVVDELGTERFREELESYVSFEFEPYDEEHTSTYRGDHVGIHRQADGRRYLGLNVPTGRLRGTDLLELADLADRFGTGELRTTANQNLVLPGVRGETLESLLGEPILDEYSPDPGPFSRGIVTCTGREFCKYGVIETKRRGYRWAESLDEWLASTDGIDEGDVPDAVRVHMSGCSASCAQPQIADVGLRGEAYRDEQRSAQAVDVGFGGDLEADRFVDWVSGRVPVEELPDAIRRVLGRFAADREPGDDLADWLRRTDPDRLHGLVTGDRPVVEAD